MEAMGVEFGRPDRLLDLMPFSDNLTSSKEQPETGRYLPLGWDLNLSASPNLDGYFGTWETPGIFF